MALNILQRVKLGNAENLKELKDLVEGQGGELSEDETEWHGDKYSYEFVFPVSRATFRRMASAMKQQGWPADENAYLRSKANPNRGEILLRDMSEFAQKNKGELIDTIWHDSNYSYEFKHESGDRFSKTYGNLLNYDWPKDYLKELQDIAKNNEGTVEETTYRGSVRPHKFKHKGGTESFFRTLKSLRENGWPINQLGVIRDIAVAHGGKLLSTQWLGDVVAHEFIDKDGIPFFMTPAYLKNDKGGWPKDIDLFFRSSPNYDSAVHCMEYMRKIAKENGGNLLSEVWNGSGANMYRFKDQLGLEFEVTYDGLTGMSQWSPNRGLISEPVCRQAMKHLFSQDGLDAPEFLHSWDIVKREGERSLELDGYAEKTEENGWSYSIAFEYQGDPCHHVAGNVMDRDQFKKEFCHKNNIVLVVIDPFNPKENWESTYVSNHIKEAIEKAFKDKDMSELNQADFKVKMNEIHEARRLLTEIKKIAEDNGGRLLSTVWGGSSGYLEFIHADGTSFSAMPCFLKKKVGGWPKDIEAYRKRSEALKKTDEDPLEKLRELAKENGVKLTSEKWLGSNKPHEFKHADGHHPFSMLPKHLQRRGLPKAQKKYIEHLAKQAAKEDIISESDEEYNCFAMG